MGGRSRYSLPPLAHHFHNQYPNKPHPRKLPNLQESSANQNKPQNLFSGMEGVLWIPRDTKRQTVEKNDSAPSTTGVKKHERGRSADSWWSGSCHLNCSRWLTGSLLCSWGVARRTQVHFFVLTFHNLFPLRTQKQRWIWRGGWYNGMCGWPQGMKCA